MVVEGNRLEFFTDLYTRVKTKYAEFEAQMDLWERQYKGDAELDPLPGERERKRASAVRNITYELIETQISTRIPVPKVAARRWNEARGRNALSIERFCKQKLDELPFESINDRDERRTYKYGGDVAFVEWDNSVRTNYEVGDVRVRLCHPRRFYPQPGLFEIDEMEYCFLDFPSTAEDIARKYGVSINRAEEGERDDEEGGDDTYIITVCFWRDESDDVCQYIFSGDVELSDIDDYYARKMSRCVKCGKREELCECEAPEIDLSSDEYEELTHDIITQNGVIPAYSPVVRDGVTVTHRVSRPMVDEMGRPVVDGVGGFMLPVNTEVDEPVMERTRIPWYKPKRFPVVIRRNTSGDGMLFGQSDVEFLRPVQQEINRIESRIFDKINWSSVTPTMPEGASVKTGNEIFKAYIEIPPGGDRSAYGVIDTTPDVSRDMVAADRLYEHAKRMLGISDSYQGFADTTAKSGLAKQFQIQQATGRLDSKRTMKNVFYADLYRVIFELSLAYSDEPRPVAFYDSFGRRQNASFSRYDFIERDEVTGKYFYADEYLFSTDSSGDVEGQREQLWQLNRENFGAGLFGDPAAPVTLMRYWQMQERAHYPFASEQVAYFRQLAEQQMAASGGGAAVASPGLGASGGGSGGGVNNNIGGLKR